jgi:hypothetical protein
MRIESPLVATIVPHLNAVTGDGVTPMITARRRTHRQIPVQRTTAGPGKDPKRKSEGHATMNTSDLKENIVGGRIPAVVIAKALTAEEEEKDERKKRRRKESVSTQMKTLTREGGVEA